MTDSKTSTKRPSVAKHGRTPDSVSDLEKSDLDEDAVTKAVTVENKPDAGTTSVLPGPPIPPHVQDEIRSAQQGERQTSGRRGPPSRKHKEENR